MVNKQDCLSNREFHHTKLKNADGTPLRVRASGKCQTWKTRPEEFKLPVKYGMYQSLYITNANAAEWNVGDGKNVIKSNPRNSGLYNAEEQARWKILQRSQDFPGGGGLAPYTIVLSKTGGVQPFATHHFNRQDGGFYSGHYFESLRDAAEDFEKRSTQRNLVVHHNSDDWTATLKKNNVGEYVVRFSKNGKHYPGMDYFTTDKEDAEGTKRIELRRLNEYENGGGALPSFTKSKRNPRKVMYSMTEKPTKRKVFYVSIKTVKGWQVFKEPYKTAKAAIEYAKTIHRSTKCPMRVEPGYREWADYELMKSRKPSFKSV